MKNLRPTSPLKLSKRRREQSKSSDPKVQFDLSKTKQGRFVIVKVFSEVQPEQGATVALDLDKNAHRLDKAIQVAAAACCENLQARVPNETLNAEEVRRYAWEGFQAWLKLLQKRSVLLNMKDRGQ